MDYVINDHIENLGEKVCHIDEKDSLNIKRPAKSTSVELNEPILKTFQDLNIENDSNPDQNFGQNGQTPGVIGEATIKSNYSISSTAITDTSQTSSEEQISKSQVGTSMSCPGPDTTEARAPMRFRSRFHLPKFRLPRTTFRQFRRSTAKHGQLVEDFPSPVSTLERNEELTTVAECPDITSTGRRRRRRFERLRNVWKGTKSSVRSCNCMRRRDRSQDYYPSGSRENNGAGLDGGRIQLPSELTGVSNENAEMEARTDHG